MSCDRFHSNHENIYRVSNEAIIRGEPNSQATTAAPMARAMIDNYPEVVKATRVLRSGSLLIGRGSEKINEDGVLFADSAFFDVFDFNLIKGNPKAALVHPKSMILSESFAKKYFGEEDPVGEDITVDEDSVFYTVTGVLEDVPANSHLQFDMLASLSTRDHDDTDRWIGRSLHTYAVLNEGADPEALKEKMKELFYEYMAPEIEYYTEMTITEWEGANNSVNFKLTPIKDIHLHSTSSEELEPTGNVSYIYIYTLIGVIILFIAIFNFVNLATAHSANRAREVGVRKVIGSSKRALIGQFIFESIMISLFATFLAVLIIHFLKPSFYNLIGRELAFGPTSSYIGLLLMLCLAIFVGILAGCYPAFVLSAFRPVDVLKGSFSSGAKSGWLRNLLVTIQFAASIVIIIGTLVIYNQIEFMLTKNLGFDKDQIMVLKRPDALKGNLEAFKNDLVENSNIMTVANSRTIPGKEYRIRSYRKMDNHEVYLFLNNQVTHDYQELMGMELISGRFFSEEYSSDSNAVVLNESAAKLFGFDDPIGKPLISAFKEGTLTIIGVVRDYNIESLHKSIEPVSLELAPNNNDGYLSIKISNGQNIRETVQFVENTWYDHVDNKPFQYFFFDEDYENLYRSESTTGQILIVFAFLSIFISCLGLIGLIAYSASIRKKEIGIRKVLGASVATLIRLLSAETARLIIIATLISWPLAYLATDYWLKNFADRTHVSPWFYVGSTLAVIIVVSFAISFQTIKACMNNPVDSLRQE